MSHFHFLSIKCNLSPSTTSAQDWASCSSLQFDVATINSKVLWKCPSVPVRHSMYTFLLRISWNERLQIILVFVVYNIEVVAEHHTMTGLIVRQRLKHSYLCVPWLPRLTCGAPSCGSCGPWNPTTEVRNSKHCRTESNVIYRAQYLTVTRSHTYPNTTTFLCLSSVVLVSRVRSKAARWVKSQQNIALCVVEMGRPDLSSLPCCSKTETSRDTGGDWS